MKLFKLFALLALLGGVAACDYEPFEDEEGLSMLEAVNPYVRLDDSDANGMRQVVLSDSGQVITVDVVNESNVVADLTVEYSIGGSATFGEIFTVSPGNANGGTLQIAFDDGSNTDAEVSESITITTLVDTLVNGPETIEIALTGVSATNGATYDVGQGPLYRTLTINLVND